MHKCSLQDRNYMFSVHFSVAGKYTGKYKEISTCHYLFMVSHLFWVHTFLVKQFINHSFSLDFSFCFCFVIPRSLSCSFQSLMGSMLNCLLAIAEQIYQNETFFNKGEEISHSLRLKQILLDELEQISFFSVYSFLKGETLYMLYVIIVPLFHNCYYIQSMNCKFKQYNYYGK